MLTLTSTQPYRPSDDFCPSSQRYLSNVLREASKDDRYGRLHSKTISITQVVDNTTIDEHDLAHSRRVFAEFPAKITAHEPSLTATKPRDTH